MSQGFTGQVNTNALNAPFFNGGRLTAASGQPVADATSVGTIYWTPYKSGTISLYNGTNYQTIIASETALALTATSGSVYDVFGYLSGTVMVLESLVWTDTTTRATAVNQDSFGVYSKSTDRTRRYLGTFYASGTNQVTDSTAIRGLWNMDNRISRYAKAVDTTATWTYTSNTIRARNNNTTDGVGQVTVVVGLSEDLTNAIAYDSSQGNAGYDSAYSGVGIDSTTTRSNQTNTFTYSGPSFGGSNIAEYKGTLAIGKHTINALEYTGRNASGTTTHYGSGTTYWFAGDTLGGIMLVTLLS